MNKNLSTILILFPPLIYILYSIVQTFIQIPTSVVIAPINSYWEFQGLECDIELFEIDTI